MKILRTICWPLIKIKEWIDPNYWASRVGESSGLYDKARNSKTRQWADSLEGWKWWAWRRRMDKISTCRKFIEIFWVKKIKMRIKILTRSAVSWVAPLWLILLGWEEEEVVSPPCSSSHCLLRHNQTKFSLLRGFLKIFFGRFLLLSCLNYYGI